MDTHVFNKTLSRSRMIRILLVVTSLLLMFCVVKTVKAAVMTEDNDGRRVFACDSVIVEENDTLWDIAMEYYTDDYSDIYSYISEIMKTNNMVSEIIYTDDCLIIPYYK